MKKSNQDYKVGIEKLFKWDYIVLTASNNNQVKFYESEIKKRIEEKRVPITKYLVIADPNGERIGSGGATLNIIKYLHNIESLNDKKVLIIHSGGDSIRIPQFSATGKIFSKLPNGNTLFDELMITFWNIPSQMDNGIVCMSGDVLLEINPENINFKNCDSACVSIKEKSEIGSNHGSYIINDNNEMVEFLHKMKIEVLKEKKAIDSDGMIDIDTGIVYFNSKIVKNFIELINNFEENKFINNKVRLNLYGDIIYPFAINSTLDEYLKQNVENEITSELIDCREKLWNILNNYKMKVIKLNPAKFIHLGTSNEWLNFIFKDNNKYFSNNSYISEDTKMGLCTYIENSYIENCIIGNSSIISNCKLINVFVPDNICLISLRLLNQKFVTIIYSINDNLKQNKIFLNNNIERFINKYNISINSIWDNKNMKIWNAKLFKVCDTEAESIASALKLNDIINCKTNQESVDEYFKTERECCDFCFKNADILYINKHKEDVYIENKFQLIKNMFFENIDINSNINKNEIKDYVKKQFPIRVNFGGGWTDTPPYCNEHGGSVLNSAFLLDGKKPIEIFIKKIDTNEIILESKDQEIKEKINNLNYLKNFKDTNLGIHKSALYISGIVKVTDENIDDVIKRVGSGIYLSTNVNGISKGSGLGISSILCAGCLDVIHDFLNIKINEEELANKVLLQEQLIGSGGGWQDQLGSIIPGFKLIKSKPRN